MNFLVEPNKSLLISHGADYASCTKSSAFDCRQYMVLDARKSRLALRPPHCVLIFLLTLTLRTSFAHRTQGTTGWPRACRDTPRLRLWGHFLLQSLPTLTSAYSGRGVFVTVLLTQYLLPHPQPPMSLGSYITAASVALNLSRKCEHLRFSARY